MVELKMREDGTFTILQLTDLHIGSFPFHKKDEQTFALLKEMTEKANPDLIVITGDVIWSEGVPKPEKSFNQVIDVLNDLQVPVAITYGNHDTEEGIARSDLRSLEEKLTFPVEKKHFHVVEDRASFCVEVFDRNGRVGNVLYLIDSGSIDPLKIGTYEYVHPDQVTWFNDVSKTYGDRKKNEKSDLLFLHIPLPEYKEAWVHGRVSGTRNEVISSPLVNTGLFTSILIDGRVAGVFCGHDHDNDFVASYHGVKLGFGRVSGYHCYGELVRGGRVIQLRENEPFTTNILETDPLWNE